MNPGKINFKWLLSFFLVFTLSAKEIKTMNIEITSKDLKVKITLTDNPTAKSLYEQLPMTLKIEDYAATEKIFYPPKKLSLDKAPEGYEPQKGDVTYYSPWGDVAIFYKKFSYANGLVPLGKVIEGEDDLMQLTGKNVTITKVK